MGYTDGRMIGTAFFLLLTLFSALVLVIFLLRAGAARPASVWALAALLPVLAAMTASKAGQARAERTLRDYPAAAVSVVVHTAGRDYPATLDAESAACLERLGRLHSESNLERPQGTIPIRRSTTVDGALPPSEVVEALSLRGRLDCQNFKALKKRR